MMASLAWGFAGDAGEDQSVARHASGAQDCTTSDKYVVQGIISKALNVIEYEVRWR